MTIKYTVHPPSTTDLFVTHVTGRRFGGRLYIGCFTPSPSVLPSPSGPVVSRSNQRPVGSVAQRVTAGVCSHSENGQNALNV